MKTVKFIFAFVFILAMGIGLSVLATSCFVVNDGVNAVKGISSRTLNADHILQNYEMYFDLYSDVKAKVNQYNNYDSLMATASVNDKSIMSIERTGIYGYIQTTIGDYNAKSKMLNRNLFKDNNLPFQMDIATKDNKLILIEN